MYSPLAGNLKDKAKVSKNCRATLGMVTLLLT